MGKFSLIVTGCFLGFLIALFLYAFSSSWLGMTGLYRPEATNTLTTQSPAQDTENVVSEKTDVASASPATPTPTPIIEIGASLRLPLNQPKEEFIRTHDAKCFQLSDAEEGCEIKYPTKEECPSQQPCTDIVYSFDNGKLSGFMAGYSDEDWNTLRAAANTELSDPNVKYIPPLDGIPMSSDYREWKTPNGFLTFVEHVGVDYQGNALRSPHSIFFGPKSSINNDVH
jgi:hypothetical protein